MSTTVKDILERTFWTFVQAFVAALLSSQFLPELSNQQFDKQTVISAGVAALAAVLALVKGYLASWGNPNTISPASTVKPQTEKHLCRQKYLCYNAN